MVEKDNVFATKIKQSGIFDFKDFYRFAYEWLDGEGYDVAEGKYSEKISPGGKEIEIEWEAKRKISDYFRFVAKVRWRITGMKDVEVQKNGEKINMNKGTVEIRSKGVLEKDYEHRWEDNPFLKFLRGVYDRYIIRARIDQYETKLIEEVDEFIGQCKAFLAMEAQR